MSRLFAFQDLGQPNGIFITSEDAIRKEWYSFWLNQMNKKFGAGVVYSFEDCLQDWIVINYAWEIKEFEHLP
jgi:hypothetical protein